VEYHDHEWGVPVHDDAKLFEMLLLESFQAGLSWECILNKRDNFRKTFDNFDYKLISNYDINKITELKHNEGIIRNELKIKAAIKNAQIFMSIQAEFGSFDKYIWNFTCGNIIIENDKTTSQLSDNISKDLKKRGMTFVGSTIIYSFLQAIGLINSHDKNCYFFNN
jgi:DNA-3-methyladenine glycosylase I